MSIPYNMFLCVCVYACRLYLLTHNFKWGRKKTKNIYWMFISWSTFLATNSVQSSVKKKVEFWVLLLRMSLSLVPLAVLTTFLSPQLQYTQRHLGDALTQRALNECGKWEYQFDELCYSISAINFPVAPLSKMEFRMIEPLFRYLILFLGSCLHAYRFLCVWMCACEEGGIEGEKIFRGVSFCLWTGRKRNCVLACSLHKTSFCLISSNLIIFTSDLAWAELQIGMHWRNSSL